MAARALTRMANELARHPDGRAGRRHPDGELDGHGEHHPDGELDGELNPAIRGWWSAPAALMQVHISHQAGRTGEAANLNKTAAAPEMPVHLGRSRGPWGVLCDRVALHRPSLHSLCIYRYHAQH